MADEIIYVDEKSEVPLFGVDFLGIIDRGTNIIEIKPITLCNLKCRYCFVRAGDFATNYMVNAEYLVGKLEELLEKKGDQEIEIHIAPYGEILLYPELIALIKALKNLNAVSVISMQTNGLLLSQENIQSLELAGLTRINISLNTMNQQKARYLSDCFNYNIQGLLQNIEWILESNINLLIAPVWFPGENDEDIEEIIKWILKLKEKGYNEEKLRLGIQKYLIYKTGRKLKKIRPKSWGYFYDQLRELEKKYSISLILTPEDFNIHKSTKPFDFNQKKGDLINVTVISKGRWDNECIGIIQEDYGIKVLLNRPIRFSEKILGKTIQVKILKANYKDNIITAFFPV